MENQEKKSELSLKDVKEIIFDLGQGYHQTFKNIPIWSEIMQKADEVGHFASEIVERVILSHKSISEKQAWVVAYFAKNNGLINA
jgi:hypothetical protein